MACPDKRPGICRRKGWGAWFCKAALFTHSNWLSKTTALSTETVWLHCPPCDRASSCPPAPRDLQAAPLRPAGSVGRTTVPKSPCRFLEQRGLSWQHLERRDVPPCPNQAESLKVTYELKCEADWWKRAFMQRQVWRGGKLISTNQVQSAATLFPWKKLSRTIAPVYQLPEQTLLLCRWFKLYVTTLGLSTQNSSSLSSTGFAPSWACSGWLP